MSAVAQYILKITSAAMLISIITCIIDRKSPIAPYIKLVSGLFLTIVVFSPILHISVGNITGYLTAINADAESIVSQSQHDQQKQILSIIKSKTETYILEKAQVLGLDVCVEIEFVDTSTMIPSAIRIEGAVSPFAKQQLTEIISNDIGIPEASQKWY